MNSSLSLCWPTLATAVLSPEASDPSKWDGRILLNVFKFWRSSFSKIIFPITSCTLYRIMVKNMKFGNNNLNLIRLYSIETPTDIASDLLENMHSKRETEEICFVESRELESCLQFEVPIIDMWSYQNTFIYLRKNNVFFF